VLKPAFFIYSWQSTCPEVKFPSALLIDSVETCDKSESSVNECVGNEYIEKDRSFIGGAADRNRLSSSEGVISEEGVSRRVGVAKRSVAGGNEGGASAGRNPDKHSADVEHFGVGSWSLEGIQAEQRADPVIGKVIEFSEKDTDKPP